MYASGSYCLHGDPVYPNAPVPDCKNTPYFRFHLHHTLYTLFSAQNGVYIFVSFISFFPPPSSALTHLRRGILPCMLLSHPSVYPSHTKPPTLPHLVSVPRKPTPSIGHSGCVYVQRYIGTCKPTRVRQKARFFYLGWCTKKTEHFEVT